MSIEVRSQLTLTYSKSTAGTVEKVVKLNAEASLWKLVQSSSACIFYKLSCTKQKL